MVIALLKDKSHCSFTICLCKLIRFLLHGSILSSVGASTKPGAIHLAQKHAIKTQENSSDVSILVRYITRADRKTTHVYARAIDAAKQLKVKSAKFIEFVEAAGGIEQLRLISADSGQKSTKAISNELADSNLWEFVKIRAQQPFASIKAIKGEFPGMAGSSTLHFFAAVQGPGSYEVIGEVPVDEATELKLLDHMKQQVALALIEDPDALTKMLAAIEAKKAREAQKECEAEIAV